MGICSLLSNLTTHLFFNFLLVSLHEVIMIRPLVAIGALVVLTSVAEAASTKYEDYYKGDSYEHDPEYYEEEYREPTFEKYDDEYGYEEHKYDHKPMYKHKTMRSHYGYGGDSYGKSYSTYGDDSYSKSYNTYSSYKPSNRYKRSVVRVGQAVGPAGVEMREGLRNVGAVCTNNAASMCDFPFTYKGRTFWSCTKFDWNVAWCAVGTNNGNYAGTWATCVNC